MTKLTVSPPVQMKVSMRSLAMGDWFLDDDGEVGCVLDDTRVFWLIRMLGKEKMIVPHVLSNPDDRMVTPIQEITITAVQ